eukprot:23525-Chlamydomonas_euryale.AAC.1
MPSIYALVRSDGARQPTLGSVVTHAWLSRLDGSAGWGGGGEGEGAATVATTRHISLSLPLAVGP